MKNGYDKFFESAKRSARKRQAEFLHLSKKEDIRLKENMKKNNFSPSDMPIRRSHFYTEKKVNSFPLLLCCALVTAFLSLGYASVHLDEIDAYISKIEFGLFESSLAQSEVSAPPDSEAKKKETPTIKNDGRKLASKDENIGSPSDSEDHFLFFAERKRELDEREAELSRAEAELAEQKSELEKKMLELEQTRRSISSVLEDRVKTDEQRLETLVQMYSKMRPPQAAKIFETMDEGLVIEIIGRMKKDVAANIMNLIKPEKAQIFSEKFAGYKTK
jgi:flagellar motility protein MotE (MotC chaperone)